MHRPIATILILIAILLSSPSLALSQGKPAYPPPPPATSQENLGAGVQRTMTLLATSTPQHRNKVRILVYGQSISEQDWWKRLADDPAREYATTVAQGLPNEKHTLELLADGPSPPPIRAIRICRPPVRPEPPPTPKP